MSIRGPDSLGAGSAKILVFVQDGLGVGMAPVAPLATPMAVAYP